MKLCGQQAAIHDALNYTVPVNYPRSSSEVIIETNFPKAVLLILRHALIYAAAVNHPQIKDFIAVHTPYSSGNFPTPAFRASPCPILGLSSSFARNSISTRQGCWR